LTKRKPSRATQDESPEGAQELVARVRVNSGGRLPPLDPRTFTDEQKRLAYEISTYYGGKLDGPHAIWFRAPALAKQASRLNNELRTFGKLERRLFELAVLVTARRYSAQFEWCVHEPSALKAGLSRRVVEAIRQGETPIFERPDDEVVYETVSELQREGTLSRATYDRALSELGESPLIELVTVAGFYTMVSFLLNAFDAPLPEGLPPPLS